MKQTTHITKLKNKSVIEKRHQAYLEAMNIPVWLARHQPEVATDSQIPTAPVADAALPGKAVSQGLKLGPGSDGVLLICARDSDSASKLANDIARVLLKNPVWGWPDSDNSAVTPFDAVNENLFTCVAIFGDALAQLLFAKQVPAALGSATVVILPAMSELESSSDARRKLWSELCRSGMIVA